MLIECLRSHVTDQVKSAVGHCEKAELRIALGVNQLPWPRSFTEPAGRSRLRPRHVEAVKGLAAASQVDIGSPAQRNAGQTARADEDHCEGGSDHCEKAVVETLPQALEELQ